MGATTHPFPSLAVGNYPPSLETGLSQACTAFVAATDDPLSALSGLLNGYAEASLPARRHGTHGTRGAPFEAKVSCRTMPFVSVDHLCSVYT